MFWIFAAILLAAWIVGRAIKTSSNNNAANSPVNEQQQLINERLCEMLDDIMYARDDEYQNKTRVLTDVTLTNTQKVIALNKLESELRAYENTRRQQQKELENKWGIVPALAEAHQYGFMDLFKTHRDEYHAAIEKNAKIIESSYGVYALIPSPKTKMK